MNITLNDYITNPMQKAGRVYTAAMRDTQRTNYTNRYNNVMMRERGVLTYYKYYDKTHNIYYIHIKIPSEPVKKFYYDVVFRFYTDSKVQDLGRDLSKYYVQFFSNDPAFVFTYAHVFNKADLFVKDLTDKMAKKAIKDAAKITNPESQIGYVKSLFFAYLFMKNNGLLNTNAWGNAQNYSKEALSRNIMHADQKIAERIDEGHKLEKKKEVKNDGLILPPDNTNKINRVTRTPKVKTVGKVNTIKPITNNRKRGR